MNVLAVILSLIVMQPASQPTLTVWSYELPSGGPKHAHTWLVATCGKESVCLSWGPVGAVKPLGAPEPGRNMTHAESLGWAKTFGAEVRSLGPFQISQVLFGRAKAQKANLENCEIMYKAVAVRFPANVGNCYTVLANLGHGMYTGGATHGHKAARRVAKHLLRSDR